MLRSHCRLTDEWVDHAKDSHVFAMRDCQDVVSPDKTAQHSTGHCSMPLSDEAPGIPHSVQSTNRTRSTLSSCFPSLYTRRNNYDDRPWRALPSWPCRNHSQTGRGGSVPMLGSRIPNDVIGAHESCQARPHGWIVRQSTRCGPVVNTFLRPRS